MKYILRIFLISFLAFTFVPIAQAWREIGHFVVCQIGYNHLTPKAKSKIDTILGGEDKFATQCT